MITVKMNFELSSFVLFSTISTTNITFFLVFIQVKQDHLKCGYTYTVKH